MINNNIYISSENNVNDNQKCLELEVKNKNKDEQYKYYYKINNIILIIKKVKSKEYFHYH